MHYCCRVFGVIVLEVDESVLVFGFYDDACDVHVLKLLMENC